MYIELFSWLVQWAGSVCRSRVWAAVVGVLALAGCHGVAPYTGSPPASTLGNTYWQLVRAESQTANTKSEHRRPYILLTQQKHRLQGFSGCNNLTGGYEHDGHSLQFKHVARTRKACRHGMTIEHALVAALKETRQAHIQDHRLTLLNADEQTVAVFEARVRQFESN